MSDVLRDLSPREAADVTGLSRSLIYREIERGNLAAYKRGGRIRIEPQALAEWKEAGRICPRPREPAYEPARSTRADLPGYRFTADLQAIRRESTA